MHRNAEPPAPRWTQALILAAKEVLTFVALVKSCITGYYMARWVLRIGLGKFNSTPIKEPPKKKKLHRFLFRTLQKALDTLSIPKLKSGKMNQNYLGLTNQGGLPTEPNTHLIQTIDLNHEGSLYLLNHIPEWYL